MTWKSRVVKPADVERVLNNASPRPGTVHVVVLPDTSILLVWMQDIPGGGESP